MKRCPKCKEEKELDQFYNNCSLPSGKSSYCKPCQTAANRATIEKNPELHRATQAEYRAKNKAQVKQWNIEASAKYQSNPLNRLKHACRSLTGRMVKNGIINKYPCEICGDVNSQAHHKDYSKPWDVEWLCIEHHKALHRRYKRKAAKAAKAATIDTTKTI